MARKKRTPEENARREKIRELLRMYVGRGYTQFNTSVLYFTDILPL